MERPSTDETVAEGDILPIELANHPDYEIIRKLGGGSGTIYLARNRLLGRLEVLRIIPPDIIDHVGETRPLLHEIRLVARLRHPNIVTAYAGFRAGLSLVLAMEYAEGLDLARLVKASGPLPIAYACSCIHQAALGLQHAHRAGLLHRDIKPGNLMVTRKGSRAIVKVLDFGLAKAGREQGALSVYGMAGTDIESTASGESSSAGRMVSSPDYIAPEQIAGAAAADIRADIYSLGCTLYFLLSGRPPFDGATVHDILQAQHSMNALPLNRARPDVPAELAALVAKAMSKNPDERFQTPADLAQALLPLFKRRQGAADRPNFGAADTSAASAVAPAGHETAVWSSLIDLTEPPDDWDDDAVGDQSHPRRYAIAGMAGLTATLVLVGMAVGLRALRSGPATMTSTKTGPTPAARHPSKRANGETSPDPATSPGNRDCRVQGKSSRRVRYHSASGAGPCRRIGAEVQPGNGLAGRQAIACAR